MTKQEARAIAHAGANTKHVDYAVIRHKSKFAAMTLERAIAQEFYVMEIVRAPRATKPGSKGGVEG